MTGIEFLKENREKIISELKTELKDKGVSLVPFSETMEFHKNHYLSKLDYYGAILYALFQTYQLNTKRK